GLNDSGRLTFTGTAGVSNSWAVFTGSASVVPSLVAYSNEPAPGGGFFNFGSSFRIGKTTIAVPDNSPLVNNENDVAFRSLGSGIYLVDGTGPQAGTPRTGILSGSPVPLGGDMTFSPVTSSTNFALGPDEQLAAVMSYGLNSNPTNQGMFFLRKDGNVARV